LPAQSVMTTTLTRTVTVAAGVFAPGHLGELTRYLPFELVDDVLAQTGTMQRRLRVLPSRIGVYFVLALGLFSRIGYARVWAKLCTGLVAAGMVVPAVSEKALRELRRRLGPAPFKALFEVIAGPLAQPRTPGVCFAGMRTVAFDGLNSLKIPDTDRNRCWIGRIWYRLAFAGYPTLRLMRLVETGTRGLLGAVIGGAIGTPGDREEAHLARRLLRLLGPGMLLLADRAFDCATFLAEVDRTGAKLLVRAGCSRKPPVVRHLPEGSYLSQLGGLPVRIIEATLTVRGADATAVGDHYRLITTLLDDRRFPAARLIRLYHERWEIETAYLALRHTLLDGHVLRSADRPGVEQEVWALLTLYQLLRTAMVDAVESRPDLDPDRASFTTALQAARDQLITAPGINPDPPPLPQTGSGPSATPC
jgi:Insertion element 4 transposase N-terminal/Transposase DDE domain